MLSACIDCLVLLNQLCGNVHKLSLCEEKSVWCAIIEPFLLYPIGYAAIMMTIYTIVVLSFERLHAICSPLTHIPIFWPYFITIVFYSITLMIPLFFHYQLVYDEGGNVTATVNPMYENPIYNTCFHSAVLVIGM